jgi:hypothetical protein
VRSALTARADDGMLMTARCRANTSVSGRMTLARTPLRSNDDGRHSFAKRNPISLLTKNLFPQKCYSRTPFFQKFVSRPILNSSIDVAQSTLPNRRCPIDVAQSTLPNRRCPIGRRNKKALPTNVWQGGLSFSFTVTRFDLELAFKSRESRFVVGFVGNFADGFGMDDVACGIEDEYAAR